MFVMKSSLDERWDLLCGVKLRKSSPDLYNLSDSAFKEDSSYQEILKSISTKYFPTLVGKYSKEEETKIKKTCEQRIVFLVNFKPANNFHSFDLNILKSQTETVTENIQRCSSRRQVALAATFYPNEISSFSVEDLKQDVSVVFYTAVKRSRPWIGLYMGLTNDEKGSSWVEVQWLTQEKKKFLLR